jgi:hypothetical protein
MLHNLTSSSLTMPLGSAVVLIAVICAASSIVIHTLINGISPMPTSDRARRTMLKLAKELSTPRTVVDLGSGWGTLTFPLANLFPDAEVIGYENSPVPYFCSIWANWLLRVRNLRFAREDFYRTPLDKADLVVCYLYGGAMERLRPKFERELRAGTVVVSNCFAIPQWKPVRVVEAGDVYRSRIYVYVVGE